jgi:hypothetical protein
LRKQRFWLQALSLGFALLLFSYFAFLLLAAIRV